MSSTYNHSYKQSQPLPPFNYDQHIKELNDKFGRLVKQLGTNNKVGTTRHGYEVEFAYALHELKICPVYMQGKRFEQASSIISNLHSHLKSQE